MSEKETSVDYQIGAHDVDVSGVDFGGEGDNDFIEFNFEAQAVFKRLADDIYESPAAGIREPLTNAITAIFQSVNEGYIDESRGTVEITLEEDADGGLTLTIRDNGIGITNEEIQTVLAVIGRSTVRDSDNLAGQFGMGFLSMYKLAGTDGGFIMHTRSRRNDEYTSGLWKSGGFAPSPDGFSYGELEDGEYGTKFIIPLKETIDGDSVRGWVEEYAKYARTPVIYREFGPDGSEQFNEDYGDTNIEDTLDVDHEYEYVTYDDEYFTAVSCSNGYDNLTLLLDVPIKRNTRNIHSAPWGRCVKVRLKTENSIVVDGPHEGLRPVSESEYRDMDETRQEAYIPEKRLTDEDVVLPGPIGTRDKLAPADDFWKYVGEKLTGVFNERVVSTLQKLDSPSDISDLSLPEADFLINKGGLPDISEYDPDAFESRLKSDYGYAPSNREVIKALNLLNHRVSVAPRDEDNISKKKNRKSYPIVRVMCNAKWGEFDSPESSDGEVYMGVSMNKWKAGAVHEANSDNVVVAIDNSDDYDIYEDVFGWKKLRSIRKTNFGDKLGFDEDEQKRILNDYKENQSSQKKTGDNPANSTVKLHGDDESRSITLGRLKEGLEAMSEGKSADDAWDSYYSIPKHGVVAVPLASEKNLADVEWLASKDYTTVSLSKDEWDYLKGTPRVWHAEDIVETVSSTKIFTSEGTMSVSEAKDEGTLLTHIVPEYTLQYFQKEDTMKRVIQMFSEEPWSSSYDGFSGEVPDDLIYVALTPEDTTRLSPALRGTRYIKTAPGATPPGSRVRMVGLENIYLLSKVPEWWGSSQLQFIESKVIDRSTKLGDKSFQRFVEMLKTLHDNGFDPSDVDVPDEFS